MRNNKVFNGKRLKIARSYRGKTVDILAKDINVNRKDILAFEDNKYRPTPENAIKISKALNFPKEYFFENEGTRVIVEGSHFNPQSVLSRVEEISFREKIIMIHRIHSYLNRYVSLPELTLPRKMNRNSSVEELATTLRIFWELGNGPVENLVEAVEANGIIVSAMNVDKRFATPLTQKQSINKVSTYLVCLGNDENCAPVRNNDLAYELGFIISNELGLSAKKFSKDEFAASFLLPREEFTKDLNNTDSLEDYLSLKKKWKVPVSTMLFRAYQLGNLSYKRYNYLMNEMQKQGWLKKEPLDDTIKANNPEILKSAVNLMINENIMSKTDLVENLDEVDVMLYKEDIDLLIG